jgi:hypothetical protein
MALLSPRNLKPYAFRHFHYDKTQFIYSPISILFSMQTVPSDVQAMPKKIKIRKEQELKEKGECSLNCIMLSLSFLVAFEVGRQFRLKNKNKKETGKIETIV